MKTQDGEDISNEMLEARRRTLVEAGQAQARPTEEGQAALGLDLSNLSEAKPISIHAQNGCGKGFSRNSNFTLYNGEEVRF
jgi:hypothetical protein